MKKNVLSLSIATALAGFDGTARPMTVSTTSCPQFVRSEWGFRLLVPYYGDGRVPVRYRGARSTDAVYDFREFLK